MSLPYASDRPVGIDRSVSYLVLLAVGGLGVAPGAKVVSGVMIPGGAWREIKIGLDAKGNALGVGPVLGAMVDFVIISWVVFVISKKVLGAAPPKK